MDTCSNCGADVRSGAKFCTACGTRLNDVDSSSVGSSGWGLGPPVEDTPSATEPPVADEAASRDITEERPETARETSSTPAPAWTWGSSTTDDPAERTPVTQADDNEQASSSAADNAQSPPAPPAPTGDFQWSWGSTSSPNETPESDASSTEDVLTDQPSGTNGREHADPPQAAEVVENGEDKDDDATAEDQAGREDREAELADAAPPYDWRQSVGYSYEERAPAPADSGVGMHDASGDETTPAVFADSDGYGSGQTGTTDSTNVQARAVELLDELRSLIPALGVTAGSVQTANVSEPTGQSFDTQGVIADLERATSGISSSDDLRSALESAQSRPRDMDVILDLVGRAGSLIDLIDERDRLVAAIERARSSLS